MLIAAMRFRPFFFVKAWTRIICSSYKFYREHSLAESMGISTQPFVSFVSVHQADVILKALSPHKQVNACSVSSDIRYQ